MMMIQPPFCYLHLGKHTHCHRPIVIFGDLIHIKIGMALRNVFVNLFWIVSNGFCELSFFLSHWLAQSLSRLIFRPRA